MAFANVQSVILLFTPEAGMVCSLNKFTSTATIGMTTCYQFLYVKHVALEVITRRLLKLKWVHINIIIIKYKYYSKTSTCRRPHSFLPEQLSLHYHQRLTWKQETSTKTDKLYISVWCKVTQSVSAIFSECIWWTVFFQLSSEAYKGTRV